MKDGGRSVYKPHYRKLGESATEPRFKNINSEHNGFKRIIFRCLQNILLYKTILFSSECESS
jgi:hypothetical protein